MRKSSVFLLFFMFFLGSRLFYLKKHGTRYSDVYLYSGFAHAMMNSLGSDRNVYEVYKNPKNGSLVKKYFNKGYKDFSKNPRSNIEYPPLALMWVSLPGFFVEFMNPGMGWQKFLVNYNKVYPWFMFILDLLFFLLFAYVLGELLPKGKKFLKTYALCLGYYIVAGLCIFIYYYFRLDLTLSFLLLLSATSLFLWKEKWLSFFVLALAINYKLVPLILVPLWALGAMNSGKTLLFYKQKNWASLLGGYFKNIAEIISACFFVFLPFFLVYGKDCLSFFSYHSDRPVQVESFYSLFVSLLGVFGHVTRTADTYGSTNIFSSVADSLVPLIPFIMIFSFSLLFFFFISFYMKMLLNKPSYKKKKIEDPSKTIAEEDPRIFMSFMVVFLLLAILTFKVLSPQFILWFLFLIPLSHFSSYKNCFKVCVMAFAFCLLSCYIWPYLYKEHFLNQGSGLSNFGIFILGLRNLLLLSSFVAILREVFSLKKMRNF